MCEGFSKKGVLFLHQPAVDLSSSGPVSVMPIPFKTGGMHYTEPLYILWDLGGGICDDPRTAQGFSLFHTNSHFSEGQVALRPGLNKLLGAVLTASCLRAFRPPWCNRSVSAASLELLTRECRTFSSSGVSSAQLDKGICSDLSLTGGISPRDMAPKYLQEKGWGIEEAPGF